jgi:hypothetical protein
MKENGLEIKEMDMGFIYGLMELDMKANGKIIKLTEKENFIILMVIYLKVYYFNI